MINRDEEEKAKSLLKLKAEKRSSWRSLQTGDVHREAAGKTKAWKTRDQSLTSLSHPHHHWSPLPGA